MNTPRYTATSRIQTVKGHLLDNLDARTPSDTVEDEVKADFYCCVFLCIAG